MSDDKGEKPYNTYGDVNVDIGTPPPCYILMKGRVIAYTSDTELVVKFPVVHEYLNPGGSMQGGIITAAFDNVFGPLCLRASGTPMSAMVNIDTSYHRPAFEGDELTITARVKAKGRKIINMEAEARNRDNKLVATAHCNYMILKQD